MFLLVVTFLFLLFHLLLLLLYQLIMDPNGNPFVQLPKPCVSVYLACSPVGFDDEDAIAAADDWECCCSFSLTIMNQGRVRRDVTWHSNLREDRFHPHTREWGVHRLLSLRRIRDHGSGFLGAMDSIHIQARIRLLYITLRVFTSPSFRNHQGFGVVDPTTTPPLSYDIQQMTTVTKVRAMIAKDLNLPSPDHLRLWVVTQQWAESPAAPRLLLTDDMGPLLVPTTNHLDGVGVVRVWAEVSGDQLGSSSGQELSPIITVPDALAAAYDADVQGEDGDDIGAVLQQQLNVQPPPPPPPAGQPAAAAIAMEEGVVVPPPLPVRHYLLFIKWYDSHDDTITYITHLLLPESTTQRDLFSLVASTVGGGFRYSPDDLEAQTEISPAHWQEGSQVKPKNFICPSQMMMVEEEAGDPTTTTTTTITPAAASESRSAMTSTTTLEGGSTDSSTTSSSTTTTPRGGGSATLHDMELENGQVLTFYPRGR